MLELAAAPPFRLGAVVRSHGWFQTAPFAWDPEAEALERVERLPGGVVRIRIVALEDRAGVAVTADRALADDEADVLAARVRRMLQLELDLAGFWSALSFDPDLARDVAAYGAGRLLAGTSLYEDVVKGICGTNTLWRQAVLAIARLAELDPDGAFPEPEALLAAGEDTLRERARVGYRAPFLLAAARAAQDGQLAAIEADAPHLDGAGLAARLTALPGVGPATAGFLCLLMGRFDRTVVDSATLRHAARVWFDGRRPTRAEVLDHVAPAGSWAGLALYWAVIRAWQRETGLEPGDPG